MKIKVDEGTKYILNTLKNNGYKGYIVGGAVRNSLMREDMYGDLVKKDYDIDLMSDAKPDDIIRLFDKTMPTGLKHGTVTILYNNIPYEITTFRSDGEYEDNRHPDEVIFVDNVEDDLKRRDFTVNAMAYDIFKDEVIDLFGGTKDLSMRILRCVGEPDKRFKEDSLRILRGIRFASQYNFNIEPKTFISMCNNAHLLKNISSERIYSELSGILLSPVPSRGVNLMLKSGVLFQVLPELLPMAGFNQFSPYHDKDVFDHTMSVLDNVEADIILRLTALFHDSGKPTSYFMKEDMKGHFYGHENISAEIADSSLKRLKVDNRTRKLVTMLIEKHMVPLTIKKRIKIKKLINELGEENLDYFFKFKLADYGGKIDDVDSRYYRLKDTVYEIIENHEPLKISDLNISGNDLKSIGITEGKKIGDILNYLLEIVLADPAMNKYESLMNLAKEHK